MSSSVSTSDPSPESTGPTGFEPNYTPVEYFEKFLSTEDEDMMGRLVDKTNWY
jgi:hypothetical protein